MNEIYQAALAYTARGWLVFPLHTIVQGECTCGLAGCPDAGKHPRTPNGVKDASRDEVLLRGWFGDGAPPSNIGIATGERSGLTVVDIDMGTGKFGAESWAAIVAEGGEPDLGRHLGPRRPPLRAPVWRFPVP